ncbi:MAG: 4Fe-4S dicluster domain-containing protein [Armatimonadota bacterium]
MAVHEEQQDSVQRRLLSRTDIRRFIEHLMSAADHFVAPRRALHGDVVFAEVQSADQVELEYDNSLISPACYVLPQREAIFTYALPEGGPPELAPVPAPATHVLFGVRPCDVAAIQYLDRFFMGGDFVDDVYATRRATKTIVAMACLEPKSEACWCTCSHAGPVAREGYDLQLTPMGEAYLVEIGSERGRELAEMAGESLREAPEELVAERERLIDAAYEEFDRRGNIAQAMRWISGDETPAELWEELGAKCFSCGSCSLVCPVCSCFDTYEYVEDGRGARIRCWDSCRFPGYSLEASGFNPRQTPPERIFHYAHHKLCRDTFTKYGRPGCVGCGRCVQICPAQIDLPRIAEMIRERGWQCRACQAAGAGASES